MELKECNTDLEAELNVHKCEAEKWKSLYDACKFKQEDLEKWTAQEAELKRKIAQLEERLSHKEEMVGRIKELELQKKEPLPELLVRCWDDSITPPALLLCQWIG